MAARPDDADDPVEEPGLDEPRDQVAPAQPEPGEAAGHPDTEQGPQGRQGPQPLHGPQVPAGVPDVEAQWADIVARLSDIDLAAGSKSPPGRSPSGPDRPEERRRADDAGDPLPGRTIRPVGPVDDPRSWQPDPVLEEAENHFEPPDPGPVLGGDPLLTMAWTAVIGVPVLLILVVVLGRDVPGVLLATAGALLAIAVGLLLWRMPHGDDDDGSGPGAVV